MTIREKYAVLQNDQFVVEMIAKSVFTSMALEDQTVSLDLLRAYTWLIQQELKSERLKRGQNQLL